MPNRVFFIKEVGGSFSLSHLPTYTFLNSYDTKEEVAQALKEWDKQGERALWEFLIDKRAVKIPRKNSSVISNTKNDADGEAHWYSRVWEAKTDKFFEEFPEAEIETEQPIPRELINEIRAERTKQFDSPPADFREEVAEENPEPPKKIIKKPTPKPSPEKPKKIIKKPEPETGEKPEPKPEKKKKPVLKKKKIKIVDTVDPF